MTTPTGSRELVARTVSSPARRYLPRGSAQARWSLALLLALATALRLATLTHQSLWYDEAVTAVRDLHPSLLATLRDVVHIENTPPLYYVVAWLWTRVLGTGVFALRSLSALAGVGTVAVCWRIGLELASRRSAIILAAIVATNPLFVWYSQEARAYELFVLLSSVAFLYFLRAAGEPRRRELALWATASLLALLTHYFALFLIAPEAAVLLARWRGRTELRAALGAVALGTLALVPLAHAQGGRGTNWIANWPLPRRLEAIVQYFQLGESGRPLGRLVLALTLVPVAGAMLLAPALDREARRRLLLCAGVGIAAIGIPLALALAGADYLAPRYLVAAWVPLAAALALLLGEAGAVRIGGLLAVAVCAANLAVLAAVDRRPQLQRGDWAGVARVLHSAEPQRAIVVASVGALPLEYYTPGLRRISPHRTLALRELDLVGYSVTPNRTAGFTLAASRSVKGIRVLRFRATHPVRVSVGALERARLVDVDAQVLG